MKKAILSLVCIMAFAMAMAQDTDRRARLEKHLYYLASDSLHGRKAGTEDGAKARAYILQQWKDMGLQPFMDDSFEIPFERNGILYTNLVAVIPGSDENLRDEYILLGAHYDHIGYKGNEICNGADDNASGSSALIEVARMLQNRRSSLERSVIIAAFDAEELGLWGSDDLSARMAATGSLENVKCMMSIDMVGWYEKNGRLELVGAGTMNGGRELLEDNAGGLNLKVEDFETAILTATDTRSFAQNRVPTLHVNTGLKSPYHKPADDADLIDYEGLDSITCFISRVAEQMASDPEFAPSGKIATIHTGDNKPFELGVSGGFSTSSMEFPNAGLTAKGRFGWTAGITAQYNSKWRGYRLGAFYEKAVSTFPDQTDLFNSSLTYRQTSVRIPFTFLIQTRDPMARLYMGLGADANIILDSSLENAACGTRDMQWGTHFLFGAKLGHFFIEDSFFSPFTNLFDGDPKAVLSVTTCRIGWIF